MTEQEKWHELQQARPLLKSLVHQFMGSGLLEREDAMQEASMGFLEGLAKYDPQKGSSPRLYAKTWAIARLQEACNRNLLLHVPLGMTKIILSDHKAAENGAQRDARKYEPGEAGKEAGKQVMRASRFAERLDQQQTDQEWFHADILEGEIARTLAPCNTDSIDAHRLPKLLSQLTRKQQQMLYLRFSLEMTLDDSGACLGICREAARQIQDRGLKELRDRLQISANDADMPLTKRATG